MGGSGRVLGLPQWTAIYRCVKKPDAEEVIVNSVEEPERRRTFRVPHSGRKAFVAISVTKLNPPKEGKVAKRRRKKQEEPEVEEVEETTDDDELEGLEELDDDLEDLEDEEPEDEDEDEDEEEDDESDEPSMDDSLKDLRARAKAAGLSNAKAKEQKGDKGKRALIKYILKHEDEDEEEEKPKRKGGAKKGQAPPTRELPKGKLGAQDVADMVGKDARAVRVWLRKHEDEFPKDEDLGRYAFTKNQARAIAKAMKKGSDE